MSVDLNRSPSPKKLKVDLNDSFYDSEDDELFNQTCTATDVSRQTPDVSRQTSDVSRQTPDVSRQTPDQKPLMRGTPTTSAIKGRPLMHSTPVTTTLRGKPLNTSFPSVSTPDPTNELVMSTSKPFLRLISERKEQEDIINTLTVDNAAIKEERDDLRGRVIYLEQSVKSKDNEIHEMVMQLASWRKKYEEVETQLRDSQSKQSAEILQLQTQIRFFEEERRAEAFSTSSEYKKEKRDENGQVIGASPEKEDEVKTLTLKPRMTSASTSKLNFSGNL